MNYHFGKEYKLCRKILIDEIFVAKKAVKKYPFVLNYKLTDEILDKPFQVVISAPKRIFKTAVQRNRIKRVMREVFRHEKHILEDFLIQERKYLTLFLVYTSSEEFTQEVLREKFKKLINNLIEEIK